jgi:hypothetical protein
VISATGPISSISISGAGRSTTRPATMCGRSQASIHSVRGAFAAAAIAPRVRLRKARVRGRVHEPGRRRVLLDEA